jgi:hypothetical protein
VFWRGRGRDDGDLLLGQAVEVVDEPVDGAAVVSICS